MRTSIKPYFTGIEEKIIEEIFKAKSSIHIAMAWFTNNKIKDALKTKITSTDIVLKILVDNNSTNEKYYFGDDNYSILYKHTKKLKKKFLHQKTIIIDSVTVITGSYNLTNRANKNVERITVINSAKLGDNEIRAFEFLFDENYIDQNIKLLYQFPDFTKALLSTYYNFSKRQYLKYQNKIQLGDCYSYFNGVFDKPEYAAGLIFNKSIVHRKVNLTDLFDQHYISTEIENLPITKTALVNWIRSYKINNVIESFWEFPHLYHLINEEIDSTENSIEKYFKRKIENCYSYTKLKKLIKTNIDIIAEDELWKTNFEPFLNEEIVDKLFLKIKVNENFW